MLRIKQYGKPEQCEYGDCERTRGSPLRSVYHHGCVLCVSHEDQLQLGEISLPDSAAPDRKKKAEDKLLG